MSEIPSYPAPPSRNPTPDAQEWMELQERILSQLQAAKIKKNIIELSEFEEKFECLFNRDMFQSLSSEDLEQRAAEYYDRINVYEPVYVVHNIHAKTLDDVLRKENIAFVLPAIWSSLTPINAAGYDKGQALQALNTLATQQLADPFGAKRQMYGQLVGEVIKSVNPDEDLARKREQAKAMADAVTKPATDPDVVDMTPEQIQEATRSSNPDPVPLSQDPVIQETGVYL